MRHFSTYNSHIKVFLFLTILIVAVSNISYAQDNQFLENNYTKKEYRISMRDGIKLFTSVYSPNNKSLHYPILLWRTPYSVSPYGEDNYGMYRRETWFHLAKEGYIIVFQDVRGRFMSQGKYVHMRPQVEKKKSNRDVDESTDTYDTIEWLVNNIPNNNGKVGLWGISYPGFYAAMGAIDAHPALKAVSPQAPIADWFLGDDVHHNGAFCPAANFGFFYAFELTKTENFLHWQEFEFPTNDGYQFFLDMGPIKNTNRKYFKNKIKFWKKILKHGTYDEFWQSRNNLASLKNVNPAVMVVGGWFDAENAYGALQTYQAIEKNSPGSSNILIMGPWYHGGWVRSDGNYLGNISFGSKTGEFYVKNIELPFFNYFLKNKGELELPEAYVFETGSNQWKEYKNWPPKNSLQKNIYLSGNKTLTFNSPQNEDIFYDEYISDPTNPVPFTSEITTGVPKPYMVEDQRFVAGRTDVLVYESEVFKTDITIAGPIIADLFVSTTGTDSDWIVKLIDVFPDNSTESESEVLSGYQMLLRGEIMRGKFRNSYEHPEPMEAGKITNIRFSLNDLCHSFKKGHKIMVQIQSSWFPLFDRNPQKFVNIYWAKERDFQKSRQSVYFSKEYPSTLVLSDL